MRGPIRIGVPNSASISRPVMIRPLDTPPISAVLAAAVIRQAASHPVPAKAGAPQLTMTRCGPLQAGIAGMRRMRQRSTAGVVGLEHRLDLRHRRIRAAIEGRNALVAM